MAEPSNTDQSMEDILQSIKRIIADEGEPATPTVSGSDVLELTELLAEDAAPPATEEKPAEDPIEALFNAPEPAPAAAQPEPEPAPEPIAMPAPEPAVAAPAPAASDSSDDKLISDSTLAASAAALAALRNQPSRTHSLESPVFRSGSTVEDLVIEALRPMLKDWLDGNLPALVRQLVEREIRRVSGN